MGNTVYIEVVNEVPRNGGESTEVVKVYDDYNSSRLVMWEGKAPEDDKELFLFVMHNGDSETRDVIEFADEHKKSIYVNGVAYDYEEWRPWMWEFELTQTKHGDELTWTDPDGGGKRTLKVGTLKINGDVVQITETDGAYLECLASELS